MSGITTWGDIVGGRRRRVLARLALALVAAGVAGCAATSPPAAGPDAIALPDGFQPEGIATGPGSSFFVGSIPTGAVFRGDIRTGRGEVIVPGRTGRAAIGLEAAGGRLYVAGGATGQAFVYDAATGGDVVTVDLTTTRPAFVNDVVVTSEAAFFTDSLNPVVYRLGLTTMAVTGIPLHGELDYTEGFNANGIEAVEDGATLVIAQTNTGRLFRVDAGTGAAQQITLTGEAALPGADGLLLDGRTLYVVQNRANRIAVTLLGADLATAAVTRSITDARFDAPTTVARAGDRLYVVNARIDVADAATAPYRVVAVDRP